VTKLWTKVAGVLVAGAVLLGSSAAALAAPAETEEKPAAAQTEKAKAEFKHWRDQARELHQKVVAEREQLRGNLETIKGLVAELKQDPDKNRKQLEIARVDLRELKLLLGDRKQVNEQLKAAVQAFKAAVEAQDREAAAREAGRAMSLLQTKLDLLRAANHKADQAIAHLKAAGN